MILLLWLLPRTRSAMPGHGLLSPSQSRPSAPFIVLVGVFCTLALCGGSSRPDVLGLLILRPTLLGALLYFVSRAQPLSVTRTRPLLILLAFFAGWITIQLVPLPDAVWSQLPGHARFTAANGLIGEYPWRPISLVPEVTLNALIALLAPLVVLIGLATVPAEAKRAIPIGIVALALAGALAVLIQVTLGKGPVYAVPHPTPSGLFANRNHQALLLAIGIPYAALWASQHNDRLRPSIRLVGAGIAVVLLAGVIAVSGSRAGLMLGLIGIAALPFIIPARLWRIPYARAGAVAVAVAMVGFVLAIVHFDRAQSITRLSQTGGIAGEGRVEFLPVTWSILRDFLPFGAGTSVFDPLYRAYEPDWALHVGYFNRAHNDWLDLVLGGGIPAALLVIVLIVVLIRGIRRGVSVREQRSWIVAGAAALVQAAVASAVDYPLRTPLMAGIFAMICAAVLAPPPLERR